VPGVTLSTVLRPSEGEPGALTLVATVSRSPLSGLVTADNRAYPLTGPAEALEVLDFNSFTSLGERTELNLFHTFNGTQLFGQGSTEFFLGSSGLRMKVYAGAGNVTPSGFLNAQGYQGETTVVGLSFAYPLIRSRQQTLNLVAAFDMLDSRITTAPEVNGVRGPSTVGSKDSLRVLRVGGDYALSDLWAGETRPAINGISVRVSHGIAALGATHDTATPARFGEQVNFTKAAGEISRNQTLFSPWAGASVSLLGLATGQVTENILPPAEKFFLGGSRFTRGFYTGQVSGDNALALTAELQLTAGAEVPVFGRSYDVNAQYYLFYDYGQTWENTRNDPNKMLKSYGLGVRLFLTQNLEFDLEGLRRTTRRPDGANTSELNGYGVYWRVVGRF